MPALGAPKKSARVAEVTVLETEIATTERRKAWCASQTVAQIASSCLRRRRIAAARRKRKRLSALCPPRCYGRWGRQDEIRAAIAPAGENSKRKISRRRPRGDEARPRDSWI